MTTTPQPILKVRIDVPDDFDDDFAARFQAAARDNRMRILHPNRLAAVAWRIRCAEIRVRNWLAILLLRIRYWTWS